MTTAIADDPKHRRVRWLPGVILLVFSPAFILTAWYAADAASDGDRTIQMIAGIASLCLAVLVQAVWWLFFARLTWRGRLIGAVGLAAVAGLAAASVRIEGHSGEMLPYGLAFRWEPTAEEEALAYVRKQESTPKATSAVEVPGVTTEDWPQYRGPNRDGIAPGASIRTNWNEHPPKVVWKHPVGPAWSSFAVVGDLLFTQEQRGEEEVVVSYDAKGEGKQRWVHTDETRFSESLGGDGPRGTPTFADGSLYTLGATGVLNCLDPATGSVRWRRDTLKDAGGDRPIPNIAWGMAGSPLVWGSIVYVAPGGGIDRGVIGYDAGTGEPVWFSKGKPLWEEPAATADGKITMASYAAPRIETIGGAPHLLIFDGEGLKSYDPATGDLLWSFGPWTNQPKVNAAQPIVHNDRVFLSSGYTIGSALLDVKQDGDQWKVSEVWRKDNEFKLKFNDAVLHEGYLYGLDEGILACYEFETGKRKWKKGRYGYGEIVLLGETLVVLAEDGSLAAVKASPESFDEIARVNVLEGKTWNHPAYARGFLYVRNDREAACLDLRP